MDEPQNEEPASRGRLWHGPLTWTGLLALGWVIYELTAQPALGAVAVCLKFGWEQFRAALWLRRRDPLPRRGKTLFWLYTAYGLWKTSLVALIMTFAMLWVRFGIPRPGANNNPPVPWNEVTGSVAMTFSVGLLLSTLATLWALWLAWRHRFKVWLNGWVENACWEDVWPPQQVPVGSVNLLGPLLMTALVVVFLVGLVAGGILLGKWLPGPGAAAGLAVTVLLGVPVALLTLRDLVYSRILADSPEECWFPLETAEVNPWVVIEDPWQEARGS